MAVDGHSPPRLPNFSLWEAHGKIEDFGVDREVMTHRADGTLHIEGYPDAARLIALKGKKARQLSNFALHVNDLQSAKIALERINDFPEDTFIQNALWENAIFTYIKCFRSAHGRISLQSNDIYRDDIAKSVFKYFLDLRNKHIIHDENSFTMETPCAAINGGGKSFKVERVFCLSGYGVTLQQETYSNLNLLISKAFEWASKRFDELAEEIAKELELDTLDSLLSQPTPSIFVPKGAADMGINRRKFK